MKKLSLLFISMMILSLFGCVKILNEDLKSKSPKLVLNAVISPDSLFTVNVSHTLNIFDDESEQNLPFIDSADVKLYENGDFLTRLTNIGYGYYVNPGYYPSEGNNYRIEVSYGDYHPVETETAIPPVVTILEFDTVLLRSTDEYSGTTVKYIGLLKYKDPGEKENQYQLSATCTDYGPDGKIYTYKSSLWPVEGDKKFFDSWYNGRLVWDDGYTNGNEVTVRFVFFDNYDYEKSKSRESGLLRFTFQFQSITREYLTYLKSYGVYVETGGSADPFSEPVVIYSNVENGYGIFGSYTQDTASVDVITNYKAGKGAAK